MAIHMKMSFAFFTLLAFNFLSFSVLTTEIGVSKDQISCTMCDSCDNPCQPLSPPPLPPPSECPPPPSPPPPPIVLPECPPPPSPRLPPPVLPESPPPPSPPTPALEYPPPPPPNECSPCAMPPMIKPDPPKPPMGVPSNGGVLYGPPGYGTNPVPYFSNSNNNPTTTSSALGSIQWNLQPTAFSIFLAITFLCVFTNNS